VISRARALRTSSSFASTPLLIAAVLITNPPFPMQ